MIWCPAHKKGGDSSCDNLKRTMGPGGQCVISSQIIDYHSIRGDDDGEGGDEPQKEVADGHGLITQPSKLLHRRGFIIIGESVVVEALDDVFIDT